MKHPIIREKEIKEVIGVLTSGELSGFRGNPEFHLGGKAVQALEGAFCDYFSVKYAVAMN